MAQAHLAAPHADVLLRDVERGLRDAAHDRLRGQAHGGALVVSRTRNNAWLSTVAWEEASGKQREGAHVVLRRPVLGGPVREGGPGDRRGAELRTTGGDAVS